VCIHPKQVEIANEEFRPSAEEVEFARKVVKLDDEAAEAGTAAFALEGKMVDVPIVNRLRRLLARHEKIVAREARTRAALQA
jgi:citrate lyase subunit beta/citryl-CoA lyase